MYKIGQKILILPKSKLCMKHKNSINEWFITGQFWRGFGFSDDTPFIKIDSRSMSYITKFKTNFYMENPNVSVTVMLLIVVEIVYNSDLFLYYSFKLKCIGLEYVHVRIQQLNNLLIRTCICIKKNILSYIFILYIFH